MNGKHRNETQDQWWEYAQGQEKQDVRLTLSMGKQGQDLITSVYRFGLDMLGNLGSHVK